MYWCSHLSKASTAADVAAPAELRLKDLEVTTGYIPFTDIKIFYQLCSYHDEAVPVVVLLHGARFTSDTWVKLGTLQYLASQRFKAIAIDLPGYGRSEALPYVDGNMRAEVVKAVFDFVGGTKKVLLSPSMSGKFAIPFLDRYGMLLNSWLAVAPVGVKGWGGPAEFVHLQTKMLAVYGEHDPNLDDAQRLVNMFITAHKAVVPGGAHAFYAEQPDRFHAIIGAYLRWSCSWVLHDKTVPLGLELELEV